MNGTPPAALVLALANPSGLMFGYGPLFSFQSATPYGWLFHATDHIASETSLRRFNIPQVVPHALIRIAERRSMPAMRAADTQADGSTFLVMIVNPDHQERDQLHRLHRTPPHHRPDSLSHSKAICHIPLEGWTSTCDQPSYTHPPQPWSHSRTEPPTR